LPPASPSRGWLRSTSGGVSWATNKMGAPLGVAQKLRRKLGSFPIFLNIPHPSPIEPGKGGGWGAKAPRGAGGGLPPPASLHSLIPPLIPPLRGGIGGMGVKQFPIGNAVAELHSLSLHSLPEVKPFPIGNAVAELHSLSGVKPFPIGNAVASLQKFIFL